MNGKIYTLDTYLLSNLLDNPLKDDGNIQPQQFRQSQTLILAFEKKYTDDNATILNYIKDCADIRKFHLDQICFQVGPARQR